MHRVCPSTPSPSRFCLALQVSNGREKAVLIAPPLPAIAQTAAARRSSRPYLLRRLLAMHSPLPPSQQVGGQAYSYAWLAEQVLFVLLDTGAVSGGDWAAWTAVHSSLPLTGLLTALAQRLLVNDSRCVWQRVCGERSERLSL